MSGGKGTSSGDTGGNSALSEGSDNGASSEDTGGSGTSSEDMGVNGAFGAGGVFGVLTCPSSLTEPPEDERALGFNIFTPPTLAKGSSSRSKESPGSGRTLWQGTVPCF